LLQRLVRDFRGDRQDFLILIYHLLTHGLLLLWKLRFAGNGSETGSKGNRGRDLHPLPDLLQRLVRDFRGDRQDFLILIYHLLTHGLLLLWKLRFAGNGSELETQTLSPALCVRLIAKHWNCRLRQRTCAGCLERLIGYQMNPRVLGQFVDALVAHLSPLDDIGTM
jgi:hypothetical protein